MKAPSPSASYNCVGCLGNSPPLGKIIAHGRLDSLPNNSPLMKLAILTENITMGAVQAK